MSSKKAKVKSESKSGRQSLLAEHDRVENQLSKLKAAAIASDKAATAVTDKASDAYTTAAKKASDAFEAALLKASKVRDATISKANEANHKERDAISTQNGPLKRRLEWLNSEIRREFASNSPAPLGVGGRTASDSFEKRAGTCYERSLPEGVWTCRPGSIWERCRIGDRLQIRRRR